MDFKSVFGEAGFKVKENRFIKAPSHPYIVFYDEQIHRCSDTGQSLVVEHSVLVNLYTINIEEKEPMNKLENILDKLNVDYSRRIEWIDGEEHFEVSYEFTMIGKKGSWCK